MDGQDMLLQQTRNPAHIWSHIAYMPSKAITVLCIYSAQDTWIMGMDLHFATLTGDVYAVMWDEGSHHCSQTERIASTVMAHPRLSMPSDDEKCGLFLDMGTRLDPLDHCPCTAKYVSWIDRCAATSHEPPVNTLDSLGNLQPSVDLPYIDASDREAAYSP